MLVIPYQTEDFDCVCRYVFDLRQTLGKKLIGCWCEALSPLDICPLACITSGKKNTMKYEIKDLNCHDTTDKTENINNESASM